MSGSLIPIDEDYRLSEENPSCWITVRDVSVYIRVKDNELWVGAYRTGHEMEPPLDEFYGPLAPLTDD